MTETLLDTKMAWGVPTLSGTAPADRWGHTATMIDQKHMYVFGGHDLKDTPLGDVVVLNTNTFEWTAVNAHGVLPLPRDSHVAMAVGRFLFVHGGGDGKVSFGDTHMFDTENDAWQPATCSGKAPALEGHSIVRIGEVGYMYGGCCNNEHGTCYSNEIFAVRLEHSNKEAADGAKWRVQFDSLQIGIGPTTMILPPMRESHLASSCGTDMYVFGGDGDKGYLNDLWRFDTTKSVWHMITDFTGKPPCPRGGHSGCCITDKLLIFGGSASDLSRLCFNDMHIFDIETQTWLMARLVGHPPCSRFNHTLVAANKNTKVVCYGGCEDQPAGAPDYGNGPVLVLNNELAADSTIAADWGPGVHFDPCTPLTSLDCFNNFMKTELIRVKNEHRDISHNEALKLVGQRWAQHPDNPKCILTARDSDDQNGDGSQDGPGKKGMPEGSHFVGTVVGSFELGYTVSVSFNGDQQSYKGIVFSDDGTQSRNKRKAAPGLQRVAGKECRLQPPGQRWSFPSGARLPPPASAANLNNPYYREQLAAATNWTNSLSRQ